MFPNTAAELGRRGGGDEGQKKERLAGWARVGEVGSSMSAYVM